MIRMKMTNKDDKEKNTAISRYVRGN